MHMPPILLYRTLNAPLHRLPSKPREYSGHRGLVLDCCLSTHPNTLSAAVSTPTPLPHPCCSCSAHLPVRGKPAAMSSQHAAAAKRARLDSSVSLQREGSHLDSLLSALDAPPGPAQKENRREVSAAWPKVSRYSR